MSTLNTQLCDTILAEARSWIGTPWMSGGSSAKGEGGGVDCSRFVLNVYWRSGLIGLIDLPIVDGSYCGQLGNKSLILDWLINAPQFVDPVTIPLLPVQPCDLVTFWAGAIVGHIGILCEDSESFISCFQPYGVQEVAMKGDAHWTKAFYQAFRPKALWV